MTQEHEFRPSSGVIGVIPEVVERPAAQWILKVLLHQKEGSLSEEQLEEILSARFRKLGWEVLSRDTIHRDVLFLSHKGLVHLEGGRLTLSDRGRVVAEGLTPVRNP